MLSPVTGRRVYPVDVMQLAAAERIMRDQKQEVSTFKDDRAIVLRDDEIRELRTSLAEVERVKEELAALLAEVRFPV